MPKSRVKRNTKTTKNTKNVKNTTKKVVNKNASTKPKKTTTTKAPAKTKKVEKVVEKVNENVENVEEVEDNEDTNGKRKRYFKFVEEHFNEDGELENVTYYGRYDGEKPKQAGGKAFTKYYARMKKDGTAEIGKEYKYTIKECTRWRKKKNKTHTYVGKKYNLPKDKCQDIIVAIKNEIKDENKKVVEDLTKPKFSSLSENDKEKLRGLTDAKLNKEGYKRIRYKTKTVVYKYKEPEPEPEPEQEQGQEAEPVEN